MKNCILKISDLTEAQIAFLKNQENIVRFLKFLVISAMQREAEKKSKPARRPVACVNCGHVWQTIRTSKYLTCPHCKGSTPNPHFQLYPRK